MHIVFLTGSIASGKSYVGSRLHDMYDIERIDLDQISREVLNEDSECINAVSDAFGSEVLYEDGTVNRSALAQKAFADDESIALLETIELPYIKQRLRESLDKLNDEGCRLCFVEVPVLNRFEDCFDLADETICVIADRDIRLQRAHSMRGMKVADFTARDRKQPSAEYLIEHADQIIENNSTIEDLDNKIQALAHHLQCKAR